MIRRKTSIAILLSSAILSGAPVAAQTAPAAPATAAAETPHDRLFRLFKDSDEAQLKRNPIFGIFRGDLRYADQFGDYITEEYYAAEKAAGEADLAALRAIDRASLNATDQLAYDVFEFTTLDTLKGYDPAILSLTKVRPVNHFSGFHTFYPTFSSGAGGAPFKTVADYDNALKRHAGYVVLLDRAIGRFREGEAAGVFETKMTTTNVIEQLATQLKQPVEESPFYGPVKKFPAEFSEADKTRIAAAYRTAIANDIYPAMKRLHDYLSASYLPKARDGHGLMYMKGGDKLYRHLVQSTTTLPLTPEEIHQTGLSEVARITGEMEKVKQEVGFQGTLPQFFEHLRTDPKYKTKTREALTQRYYDVGKAIDATLPAYFSTMPKAKLEIRPYEPFREKFEAGGSYAQGTPDGSRPGIFYFNAYDLPSRTTPGIRRSTCMRARRATTSRSAWPRRMRRCRRSCGSAATPPMSKAGRSTPRRSAMRWASSRIRSSGSGTLDDEMLRAMRLVVDTGIHSKGWTREQAIDYMLANSSMGKTDATAEVERYIAIPSQALAYKTGAMTIQRLRRKAEAELGQKFDIRDFHAQVLMTGSLPLSILEQKIDRWIAAKKAA